MIERDAVFLFYATLIVLMGVAVFIGVCFLIYTSKYSVRLNNKKQVFHKIFDTSLVDNIGRLPLNEYDEPQVVENNEKPTIKQANIPEENIYHFKPKMKIRDLKIGETGYSYDGSFLLRIDVDRNVWINKNHELEDEKYLRDIKIERTKEGFVVDVSRCDEQLWWITEADKRYWEYKYYPVIRIDGL
jgi:hypothetical protein